MSNKTIFSELLVVSLIFFVFYLFTSGSNLSSAHDSIYYINQIDEGKLFHPHHLLFNWLASYWVGLFSLVAVGIDSEILVVSLNSLFGSLVIALFYFILRNRLSLDRFSAFIGMLLPAFSFGFWFYSTTIEVYIVPIFFLLLSFYFLSSKQVNVTSFLLIGLFHGIAILFHQVHALFIFPVLYALFLLKSENGISILKPLFYYLLTILPVVSIPYSVVIFRVLKLSGIGEIYFWLTSYAHNPQYWSKLSIFTPVKAAIGFGNSIIGGHFVFAISRLDGFVRKALEGKWLMDEIFLVRNLNESLAILLFIASIIFVLTVFGLIIFQIRNWRLLFRDNSLVFNISFVWLLSYIAFFLFWDPTNVEFWILQSIIFWLIFLLVWSKPYLSLQNKSLKPVFKLGLLALSLFMINLLGSNYWLMNRENDYYWVKTNEIKKHSSEDDLIIIGRAWILQSYLERYTLAEIIALSSYYSVQGNNSEALNELKETIKEKVDKGYKVIISGEAVNLESETIHSFGVGMKEFVSELWIDYQNKWVKVDTGIDSIYILSKPKI